MQIAQHIVITGASSGIGAALAKAYAAPGIRLGLIARRMEKLESLAAECRAKSAEVWLESADVTVQAQITTVLLSADEKHPIDLLIANAGISGGTFGAGESEVQARAIFNTNVTGVLNTVHPILPRMQARRSGQIALMASLAGFRGLPSAPAYCASKAAVRLYGEGLRGELARFGVKVNVICPGYIDTPMTQTNHFPMPFLMTVEKGASIIIKGLQHNEARIAFPWPTAFGAWLLGVLPPGWTDPLLQHLPKKAAIKE
jgi:short-subunit dehydrogenase